MNDPAHSAPAPPPQPPTPTRLLGPPSPADLAHPAVQRIIQAGTCPTCRLPLGRIPHDLYNLRDAARIIGLSVDTLRRWLALGKISHYGHRGHLRVSLSEIMPRGWGGVGKVRKRPHYVGPVQSKLIRGHS